MLSLKSKHPKPKSQVQHDLCLLVVAGMLGKSFTSTTANTFANDSSALSCSLVTFLDADIDAGM